MTTTVLILGTVLLATIAGLAIFAAGATSATGGKMHARERAEYQDGQAVEGSPSRSALRELFVGIGFALAAVLQLLTAVVLNVR